MEHEAPCGEARGDEARCDEVVIEHADGTTECLDPACELPHAQHWCHAGCGNLVPPCTCAGGGEERELPLAA